MKRLLFLLSLCLSIAVGAKAAQRPRLVVNIVVSGLRADCLERFEPNFCDDGFRALLNGGVVYRQSYLDFMQTTTPAALATLTTGANPSMHGVVADSWFNYTSGKRVELITDPSAHSFGSDAELYNVSNQNIVVPTLGDRLLEMSPRSKVVTIAADALSAIVMGGMKSNSVWWIDATRAKWTTSNKYWIDLPEWVDNYNGIGFERNYMDRSWQALLSRKQYFSNRNTVVDFSVREPDVVSGKRKISRNYIDLLTLPAGNYLVADFVREAVVREQLGADNYVDLLNVCFDTARIVATIYGPESIEEEDMIYRLDRSLADLINFIKAQCGEREVLFVLTSDHGTSDAYDAGTKELDRFNVSQFKVLVNSFMSAMYGGENWVLDYIDRQLYLNRNQVYSMGLNLADVQRQVASFVLQFRGVSHVLTSTDMQSSYFGSSHGAMMQNGFYPKRSGDLTINLMAGWIEQQTEDDKTRSASGSMYDYDTHVPLVVAGCGIVPCKVDRVVNMSALASTLARVMNINRPIASTEVPLDEVALQFEGQ